MCSSTSADPLNQGRKLLPSPHLGSLYPKVNQKLPQRQGWSQDDKQKKEIRFTLCPATLGQFLWTLVHGPLFRPHFSKLGDLLVPESFLLPFLRQWSLLSSPAMMQEMMRRLGGPGSKQPGASGGYNALNRMSHGHPGAHISEEQVRPGLGCGRAV